MKANRGYKWCPTANQPAKTQASTVTNRKKLWVFASDSAKALPSPRKVTRSDEMPQRNFRMAGEISIHVPHMSQPRFVCGCGVGIELQDQFPLLHLVL